MVKVQQRGLGKGLSALISENYSQAPAQAPAASGEEPAKAGGTTEVPIRQIVPGKYQPRTVFNEEHLQELATSIRKNGIMQPIIVRPVQRAGGASYEIVAGERRWRAANLAGLTSVPVIVREITDQQALELAIIENVQRADLTPLEEANGYQRLLEEFGYTQEELSGVVGKSRSHIANLLRLLALPNNIKAMLDEGKLTMGHARSLLTAKNPEALASAIVDKGLSVRQAESLSRASHGVLNAPKQSGPRAGGMQQLKNAVEAGARGEHLPKDPDILALEMTLSENLGMSVSINDRGNGGEVLISYESLTQLDEVLRRLGGA
jgi:ParB family chromosome partitioning protein